MLVLVIYTGGTFGMEYEPKTGQLIPFNVERVLDKLPELNRLSFGITVRTLAAILDSANMTPAVWVELATIIRDEYDHYGSFVILHGTDTMAYTASALSFMLVGLNKPVILTGAQLPIGVARSDARENFITALEIASAMETDVTGHSRPIVPEVCVYFNSLLLRGNRATKQESVQFNAFASENYPPLANAGVSIDYNRPYIAAWQPGPAPTLRLAIDPNVAILKLFPGITEAVVRAVLTMPGLRGVVLETFGAGNGPTANWFLDALREAVGRGVVLFNVSQCEGGRVAQGQYQTSVAMAEIGVVSGADITTEAAITKLMILLGESTSGESTPGNVLPDGEADSETIGLLLAVPLAGEMTA